MGKMKNFKEHVLQEAVSTSQLNKVSMIIGKYLTKKTGLKMFRSLGTEDWTNSAGQRGLGVRFFVAKGTLSFRFNWAAAGTMSSSELNSVTFWDGKNKNPYHLQFDQQVSLVQTLPVVADILKNRSFSNKSVYTLPADIPLSEAVEYCTLNEASSFNFDDMFNGVLDIIGKDSFTQNDIHRKYKSVGFKIFKEIGDRFPEITQKVGRGLGFAGTKADIENIKKQKDDIIAATGAIKGSMKRGGAEEYEASNSTKFVEDNAERLTFEEQLKDLEALLKLTISGASNACFIAGRGGVGKTHTTEQVLGDLGLNDGEGYFKNTGSVSAIGLYALLFKYKNGIILFDDSDDVFKDPASRNLLKAATDTKKIRKLVWNKMGGNVVDQEVQGMTDEEILEAGKVPRQFEFSGKVIFISNMKPDKLDPDGAIRTRAFMVNINPTDVEVYEFMEKIVGYIKLDEGMHLDLKQRKHVIDLLRKGKSQQSANLRKLSRGLNMFAGSVKAGISVSEKEMARMIEMYA